MLGGRFLLESMGPAVGAVRAGIQRMLFPQAGVYINLEGVAGTCKSSQVDA